MTEEIHKRHSNVFYQSIVVIDLIENTMYLFVIFHCFICISNVIYIT